MKMDMLRNCADRPACPAGLKAGHAGPADRQIPSPAVHSRDRAVDGLGVLESDAFDLGATRHKALAQYSPHPPVGPLMLQDHGNPVRYRNIWYHPLRDYDQP